MGCPTSVPGATACGCYRRQRVCRCSGGSHHPRRTVVHRPEEVPSPCSSASPVATPIRTGNGSPRCASTGGIDGRLRRGERGAHPVAGVLEHEAPCASMARCSTSSWAIRAARIASASASHRRVEPSISVNRNVTTPKEQPPDERTPPQNLTTRHAPTSYIGGSGPDPGYTCTLPRLPLRIIAG